MTSPLCTRTFVAAVAVGVVFLGAGCKKTDQPPAAPSFTQPSGTPSAAAPSAPPTLADVLPTLPLPTNGVASVVPKLPDLPPAPASAPAKLPALPPLPGTSAPAARVIAITATSWAFAPAEVRLKKGERVTLEVTSTDVDHGLLIPALGVNEKLVPGHTVRVDVTPQEIGTFPMVCNVFCGSGHKNMRGSIVVE